jgi:hypothetical protein
LLDTRGGPLTRGGECVGWSRDVCNVLPLPVRLAGEGLPDDVVIHAGWRDIEVEHNSFEKRIAKVRPTFRFSCRRFVIAQATGRKPVRQPSRASLLAGVGFIAG